MNRDVKWELNLIVNRLPLVHLTRRVIEAYLDRQYYKSIREASQREADEIILKIMEVVNNYLKNKKMTEAIAQALGVQAAFVWQPSPLYQYDLRYHPFFQEQFTLKILSKNAYGLMNELHRRKEALGKNFIYLGDMQKDKKEPLYIDSVHYTAAMSREIAEEIADTLSNRNLIPTQLNRWNHRMVEEVLAMPIETKS